MDSAGESGPLLRVLSNLFRNRAEAADGTVSSAATATERDGALLLDVTDHGPGVPADLRTRLFEPFVSSKERGSGLGLALASRVMSYLGGTVSLVDGDRDGAHFRVEVPATAPLENGHE